MTLLRTFIEPTRETRRAYSTVRVVAGPTGFYGVAYGVVMTSRHGSREAALTAIDEAAALLEQGGSAAAPHAWRLAQ